FCLFILFVVKTRWTGRPLPPHLFSKLQTETSYKEGEEEGDTDPKRNEKKRKEKKKKEKNKRRIPIKLLLIQSNFASSVLLQKALQSAIRTQKHFSRVF
ncbi:unnamed protein product, partial [Prunus brigantina]